MNAKTVLQAIVAATVARENCERAGNTDWRDRWSEYLAKLEREHLPSGSGFDSGTKLESADESRVIFQTSFHHMNDSGMYCGWTHHKVTVTPAFDGFRVVVAGRNRDGIKEYITEQFHNALGAVLPEGAP